jgi:hypothetical protein
MALPELEPDASAPRDVTIRLEPGRSDHIVEPGVFPGWYETRLDLPQARYRILRGREVIVAPTRDTAEREIRWHLLGAVMTVLCHQRGLAPLHAGAIEIGGAAVALAGVSGAGKSTLIAALEGLGHRALTDDICAVGLDGEGAPRMWPGPRRIKLWPDAMSALGRETRGVDRVSGDLEKFSVPMAGTAPSGPLPLARLYVLGASGLGQGIQRLHGAEAVDAVLGLVNRWNWAVAMGRARAGFEVCAALARRGEVFSLDRRWGFQWLPSQAEALQRHMETLG